MRSLIILVASFFLIHIFITFLPSNIYQADLFPYIDTLRTYKPYFLTHFANFDGMQYIMIAEYGYQEFQQAYFPLFPLSIFLLSFLFLGNHVIAGIFISLLFLFLGLLYLKKFIELIIKDKKQKLFILLFLVVFPTSFFYLAVYPESLFLFLLTFSLYYIKKKQYKIAFLSCILASLTKIQGVFLVIPFLFFALELDRRSNVLDFQLTLEKVKRFLNKNYRVLFLAFSPIYGLIIYSTYLFIKYNDPVYYFHAQAAFGANRSGSSIILLPQVYYRYIKILTNSQINYQYVVALLELFIFSFVFIVLLYDLFKIIRNKNIFNQLPINLFSISALILPTLTGTFSSIPRYALISLGFFIALSKIKSTLIKILILISFGILHVVLFVYFINGYFIS